MVHILEETCFLKWILVKFVKYFQVFFKVGGEFSLLMKSGWKFYTSTWHHLYCLRGCHWWSGHFHLLLWLLMIVFNSSSENACFITSLFLWCFYLLFNNFQSDFGTKKMTKNKSKIKLGCLWSWHVHCLSVVILHILVFLSLYNGNCFLWSLYAIECLWRLAQGTRQVNKA